MTPTLADPLLAPGLFAGLRRYGDAPALLTSDGALSYAGLADRVEAAAAALGTTRRLVLVAGRNDVDTVVALVAAQAAGHPVLLTPPGLAADALVAAYDPDVVHDPHEHGPGWHEVRPGSRHELHPDLALLLSTSGSTGSPKLVRLSHDNVASNARAIADYLGLTADDRAVTTLPLHYCYGLSVLHSHLAVGASVVLTELSVVDPCLWDLVARTGATSFAGVPHTFDLLESSGFAARDLPRLRYLTQAGGRLDPDRIRAYAALGEARGWDFVTMYGQTEATARMAYLPPHLARTHAGSLGVPVPGGAFRLEPVPEAEPGVGELVYTGPNVMLGYAGSPADLAHGREVEELRTGDLARRRDDGTYTWVGRRSRITKLFGVRLDLDELERGLAEAVAGDLRVIGTDSGLHAFVTRPRDREPARAALLARAGLPGHVVHAEVLAELPRTSSGKIDQAALRRHAGVLESAELDARLAAAPRARAWPGRRRRPAATPTAEALRDLVATLLGRPDAGPEDSFVSLGGDSLSFVEVSVRLGEAGLDLPADWHHRSFRSLAETAAAPRRGVRVDLTVVLRAVAIVLVVGSHANVWTWQGGAHVLLAVVGFNLARFHLVPGRGSRERARSTAAALGRALAPAVAWAAVVAVLVGPYGPSTVLMVHGWWPGGSWDRQWEYWFLVAFLWVQVAIVALLALPRMRRWEQRSPFGVAFVALLALLAVRFAGVDAEADWTARYTPWAVAWLIAAGWTAARACTVLQRLAVSAAVLAGVHGFFGDPEREAMIVAGVLLLVWVRSVRVPRAAARVAAVLAAASLYVYVTHWQVYPHLEWEAPWLALLLSLAVGVAYQHLWAWLVSRPAASRRRRRPAGPARQGAARRTGPGR
ncbi:MAG: non-ribosomal peptide synthetase [Nocardioides sp.]|nr:non-ribosomal peptide synthetase [Nocardioides sp.]